MTFQNLILTLQKYWADQGCVLVQPMVPQGVEIVIGATNDPLFGPMIVVGLGGVLVELVQVLEQALPHVPVLVLTVPPQVAVAVVAVVPAVEPLVRSVVAAESPRHVSRRERKEQSLNSARHLRLVA